MTEVAIDYSLIKPWLRRGDIQELAEKYGISKQAAYDALKGRTKNFDFVKICYERAIERKTIIQAFNEKLL